MLITYSRLGIIHSKYADVFFFYFFFSSDTLNTLNEYSKVSYKRFMRKYNDVEDFFFLCTRLYLGFSLKLVKIANILYYHDYYTIVVRYRFTNILLSFRRS